jgi:competence ComEA-like helix-hairpin-helix protein
VARCAFDFLAVALLAFAATCALAQKQPPAKPLDLNSATVEQLTQLPGVGPVTAQAIVDFRAKSGPFRRVEDLLAIRGITERRLKELRPYVRVQPAKKAAWHAPHGVIPDLPVSPAFAGSQQSCHFTTDTVESSHSDFLRRQHA